MCVVFHFLPCSTNWQFLPQSFFVKKIKSAKKCQSRCHNIFGEKIFKVAEPYPYQQAKWKIPGQLECNGSQKVDGVRNWDLNEPLIYNSWSFLFTTKINEMLWAHFDSWRRLLKASLKADSHSSWSQLCNRNIWQLQLTCRFANLSE